MKPATLVRWDICKCGWVEEIDYAASMGAEQWAAAWARQHAVNLAQEVCGGLEWSNAYYATATIEALVTHLPAFVKPAGGRKHSGAQVVPPVVPPFKAAVCLALLTRAPEALSATLLPPASATLPPSARQLTQRLVEAAATATTTATATATAADDATAAAAVTAALQVVGKLGPLRIPMPEPVHALLCCVTHLAVSRTAHRHNGTTADATLRALVHGLCTGATNQSLDQHVVSRVLPYFVHRVGRGGGGDGLGGKSWTAVTVLPALWIVALLAPMQWAQTAHEQMYTAAAPATQDGRTAVAKSLPARASGWNVARALGPSRSALLQILVDLTDTACGCAAHAQRYVCAPPLSPLQTSDTLSPKRLEEPVGTREGLTGACIRHRSQVRGTHRGVACGVAGGLGAAEARILTADMGVGVGWCVQCGQQRRGGHRGRCGLVRDIYADGGAEGDGACGSSAGAAVGDGRRSVGLVRRAHAPAGAAAAGARRSALRRGGGGGTRARPSGDAHGECIHTHNATSASVPAASHRSLW